MEKKCFVPSCINNSTNAPQKIFVHVPRAARKQWFDAVQVPLHSHGATYCCEDHFDLEVDAMNWTYYKTMGGYLKLHKNVLPHKYIVSPNKGATEKSQLSHSAKKRRIENVEYAKRGVARQLFVTPQTQVSGDTEIIRSPSGRFHVTQGIEVPTDIQMAHKYTQTALELVRQESSSTLASTMSIGSASEFMPTSASSSSQEEEKVLTSFKMRQFPLLEKRSRFYLGLPKLEYYFVKLLSTAIQAHPNEILVVLKKIRTNDQFSRLADDFQISRSYIGKIFHKVAYPLASKIQNLIFWPTREYILSFLPIVFRARYKNVQSIIDCFEIEIEKPSNPVQQAQTWSEYKKCNTIKYFISITPNGLVNFVSGGYGGRTSDQIIVEQSGYLNVLPDNVSVLADRGFKQIDSLLIVKNCKLVRPPSHITGEKFTKGQVKESKNISSVRIHIERAIGRIREFAILKPHATVDHNLLPFLDYMVVIVGGLINLQECLVKTAL